MFKGPIPRGLSINLITLLILEGSFGGYLSVTFGGFASYNVIICLLHNTAMGGLGWVWVGFQTASSIIIELNIYEI